VDFGYSLSGGFHSTIWWIPDSYSTGLSLANPCFVIGLTLAGPQYICVLLILEYF
jgi:hypothetical protein